MGSSGKGGSSNGSRRASSASTSAAADSPASCGCGPPTPSPAPPAATVKTCTLCGEEKPLDQFHRMKTGRFGRASWCSRCKNAERMRYHRGLPPERREEIRERDRTYKRAPRRKESQAAWRRTPIGKASRHLTQCRRRLRGATTERRRAYFEAKIRELEAFIAERKRRRDDAGRGGA